MKRISFSLTIMGLSLILAGWATACGQASSPALPSTEVAPPPEPIPQPGPTPSPELIPQPMPTNEWFSDGIISDGEYVGEANYGDYDLFWFSDEQYIYIGMRAKTIGWVAVGIQPGTGRMRDADLILGSVKDEETEIYDMFGTGPVVHGVDTELGGTHDILDFGGREGNGYTTIEFRRLLHTGDEYDIHLPKGTNTIIWAYGARDERTKHSHRGYGEIQL
jgi:hypothetical protein